MFVTFFSLIWLWIGRQRSEGRARSAGSHRHSREGCRCSCDVFLLWVNDFCLSYIVVAMWIICKIKALSTWTRVFYTNVALSMRFGLSPTCKQVFLFWSLKPVFGWRLSGNSTLLFACTQKIGVLGSSFLFDIILFVQRIFTRPVYLINSRHNEHSAGLRLFAGLFARFQKKYISSPATLEMRGVRWHSLVFYQHHAPV